MIDMTDQIPHLHECRSARTVALIRSGDRLKTAIGIAHLTIQQKGWFDEGRGTRLYRKHVGECDHRAFAMIWCAGRRAEWNFERRRLGQAALNAIDALQGCPVVDEKSIKHVARKLQPLIQTDRLKYANLDHIAIVYLTDRRNIWLTIKHREPAAIRRKRELRDHGRWQVGLPVRKTYGVETPSMAPRAMLAALGRRSNGSIVREAREVLQRIGALLMTDKSYNSGVYDEDGRKLGEGYCRKWVAGNLNLHETKRQSDDLTKFLSGPTRYSVLTRSASATATGGGTERSGAEPSRLKTVLTTFLKQNEPELRL